MPTQQVEQRTDVVPQTTSTLSPQAQSLQQRMRSGQNANNGTNTGTASTGLDSTARAVRAVGQGLPGESVGTQATANTQSGPYSGGQTATAAPVGSAPTTLKLAPRGSLKTFTAVRGALSTQKPGLRIALSQAPLTEDQKVASGFIQALGGTFNLVEEDSSTGDMPNGFVDGYNGRNYYFDAKSSTHAPLVVAVHEGVHGLPERIRKPLIDALNAMTPAKAKSEFLTRYGYSKLAASDKAEEVGAYLAQLQSERPDFWQELRQKMGNKDFSALATHILSKLKEMLGRLRDADDSTFLTRHFNEGEIAKMRGLVTDAYSQAMKEQGLTPDENVTGDVVLATKPTKVGEFDTIQNKDGSMTVRGEPEAIRALLPAGVTGRVVKGGLAFTHSDAPRVKHAIEGNKTAYSRAGEVNEKLALGSDGKYLGAPEKFNTPGKIPHLRKWLSKLTKEGEAGRFWYENSSKAVLRMVGGDVQEARKFVALLAIYSPQAKVDTNSTFALRAWSQYKAGQPISVKTGVMDSKAQRALDNVDEFWSGEKTGNFFTNLLSEIDPATRGKQGATIDMWMMRAAQYASDAPTKTQYAFMENETNRIARELGWEPQQVQAAIWVAMKARMENDGVKKATEAKSEKKKWIHYSYPLKNGKPQKTRVIDNAQAHRDNWLDHAISHDPTKGDTQRAKFDFEDGLRRHIGQISWEARPGRSTGVLPGVNDAPYDQQVEFQQAVQKALQGPNGEDLLAQQLGLLMDGGDLLAPGVWQGEVAAGMQKSIAMAPAKGDDGKTGLDATQKKNLDIYSAMLGLLLRQEGVGWHRPFFNGKASGENGVEIRIGQPFTPEQAKELWTAVDSRMRAKGVADWEQGAGMISSPEGMRVVNFGALEENKAFRDLIKDSVQDLSFDAHGYTFTSDGNLVTNDWKAGPNGEDFVLAIRNGGRSDLLGWSRDVLAPRVQRVFNEFSEKYDWGNPGTLAFANKPSDGLGGVYAERGQGAREHAVRIDGTHFSRDTRSSLDGRFFGRGLKGAEQSRLAEATDPRIKERVYFYVNEGKGVTPEAGVGGVAHAATVGNLYNVKGDPLKLFKSGDLNGSETRVLDAGFDGYYFPNYVNSQGIAIVLGKASRGIAVTPTEYTKGSAPAEAPQPYKRALTSKELNAIDLGAVQAVAPSAKLRMGNLTVDAGEVDAARTELAKQGIDLPATGPVFSNKAQNLNQDIVLDIPVEGGKTAKLTVNAQRYIDQLNAREDALRMVKECMA
jgi:hypothetical protein